MHFTRTRVPSILLPPSRLLRSFQVEVWKRSEQGGRDHLHTYTIAAEDKRDALRKIGRALGLSESQWNGKNPEYVLRAA